jgi:hypothetical protein
MASESLTPGALSKLPKWAQREIEGKDAKIRELENRIRQIHEPSRVSISPLGGVPLYLPESAPVEWRMHDDDVTFGGIGVRLERHPRRPSHLLIHGGTGIYVKPAASNCVQIYLEDR